MRRYYLFAVIPISFLTGTWLGYAISEQRLTDAALAYTLATPQPNAQTAQEHTDQKGSQLLSPLSARMDVLHAELQTMKATLDQISTSIHSNTTSHGRSNTTDNISAAKYTPNEIADFQNSINAQLSDPSFNLNRLLAMPEFQKLSEQEKKPVLDELARRLDSGEIKKSTFLPGYNPAFGGVTAK